MSVMIDYIHEEVKYARPERVRRAFMTITDITFVISDLENGEVRGGARHDVQDSLENF